MEGTAGGICATPILRMLVSCALSICAETVCAAPWDGVYYRDNKPGDAVEFHGTNYTICAHNTVNGTTSDNATSRVVKSCCSAYVFELGPDDSLIDETGNAWSRTPPVWPLWKLPRAPILVRVVDATNTNPIPVFKYTYSLSSEQGKELPSWIGMRSVSNMAGTVTIEAPLSCQLRVCVDALDYLCHGVGVGCYTFDIYSSSTSRVADVVLNRGQVVEGRVLDAVTGKPLEGARVAPVIDRHPSFVPDMERLSLTDSSGNFVIHGVECEINVDHRGYQTTNLRDWSRSEWEMVNGNPWRRRVEIRLQPSTNKTTEVSSDESKRTVWRVRGRVASKDGSPVERFTFLAKDGNYRTGDVTYGTRGAFEVKLTESNRTVVAAVGNGFAMTHVLVTNSTSEVTVTMETGVVVQGRLVLPLGWTNSARVVFTPQREGRYWRSDASEPSWAAWEEDEYSTGRDLTHGNWTVDLGVVSQTVSTSGVFCLEHIAPGSYTVSVVGEGLRMFPITVRVPSDGRVLPPLTVPPMRHGTVRGRVCSPSYRNRSSTNSESVWPFARGTVWFDGCKDYWSDGIRFVADEGGMFCVTNVPEGKTTVICNYNRSFDIIDSITATCRIAAGKTTEVDIRSNDEGCTTKPIHVDTNLGAVVVAFDVGNGTREDYRRGRGVVELVGESTNACRDFDLRVCMWEDRDKEGKWRHGGVVCETQRVVRLSNTVQEGVGTQGSTDMFYPTTLAVSLESKTSDWWGRRVVWESREPVVVTGGRTNLVRIALPANSLVARIEAREGCLVSVTLFETGGTTVVCDATICLPEQLRLPFLREGKYDLLLHSSKAGWLMKTGIVVKGLTDLGTLRLERGTRVVPILMADLAFLPVRSRRLSLEMSSEETGFRFCGAPDSVENGGCCSFKNLWPGKWRLMLREDTSQLGENEVSERVLVSTNIVLHGETCVTVPLSWSEAELVGFTVGNESKR